MTVSGWIIPEWKTIMTVSGWITPEWKKTIMTVSAWTIPEWKNASEESCRKKSKNIFHYKQTFPENSPVDNKNTNITAERETTGDPT